MDIIHFTAIVLLLVLLYCSAREQYVYVDRNCSGGKGCDVKEKATYIINIPVNSIDQCKRKLDKHDNANSALFSKKINKRTVKYDCLLFKDTLNATHMDITKKGGNHLLIKTGEGVVSDMHLMSTFDTLETVEGIPMDRPGVCRAACDKNDKCVGAYLVPTDQKGKKASCILKSKTKGASEIYGMSYVKKDKIKKNNKNN